MSFTDLKGRELRKRLVYWATCLKEEEMPNKIVNDAVSGVNPPPAALHLEQVLGVAARVTGQCSPSFKTRKRTSHKNQQRKACGAAGSALILAVSAVSLCSWPL